MSFKNVASNERPTVILAYVVLLPLIMWHVFFGPKDGAAFFVPAFGLIALITFLTPLTIVRMYNKTKQSRRNDTDWQPNLMAYIGLPVIVAVVGYGVSRWFTGSVNPTGDAVYVFLATFWVSTIAWAMGDSAVGLPTLKL